MLSEITQMAIQREPKVFVTEILGENITVDDVLAGKAQYATAPTDKQIQIMESVRDRKYTCVPSANNQGKSHIAARIALWFIFAYHNSIVILSAPKQQQVTSILFAQIRQAWQHAKYDLGGECYSAMFYPDREKYPAWQLIGMTGSSAEAFSGWHADNLLIILDEATGIDEEIYDGIEGIMSGKNVRMLEISNPTTRLSDFAFHCVNPLYNTIHLNAYDHPNVIHQKEIYKGAVAPGWPAEMEEKFGREHAMFQVRVLGRFPMDEEGLIIPRIWIEAAIDREVIEGEYYVLGVDVARGGEAETVCIRFDGFTFDIIFTEVKSDIALLSERLAGLGIDSIGVDDAGLGGGVTDNLKQMGVRVYPFKPGAVSDTAEKIQKKEFDRGGARQGQVRAARFFRSQQEKKENIHFKNVMSEAWWRIREAFEETFKNKHDKTKGISIPNDRELIEQLSMRKMTTDNDVVEVLPKKDLGYPSDKADAFVIAHRAFKQSPRPYDNFVPSIELEYMV